MRSDFLQKRQSHMLLNHRRSDAHNYFKFDLSLINLPSHFFWFGPNCTYLPVWKIFFRQFDFTTLFYTLIVLLLLSLIWHHIIYKNDLVFAVLLNCQILLESPVFIKIHKTSTRLLTATSMCGFLILSSVIKNELLHSFTTHSIQCPFNSLQDIIRSNLKCFVSDDMKEYYQYHDKKHNQYVSNCTSIDENDDQRNIFRQIALNRDTAVISRTLKFKFASSDLYKTGFKHNIMHKIKPQVKFDFVFTYFTKGFPLKKSFSKVMRRMDTAGLTMFFREQAFFKIDQHLNRRKLIFSKKVSFENISFVFYLWLIGLGFATVVFCIETFK